MEGEVGRAVKIVEDGHVGKVVARVVVRSEVRVGEESEGTDYALVDRLDCVFFFFLEPGFFPEDGGLDFLPLLPFEAESVPLSAAAAFWAGGFDFFFEALGEEPLLPFFGGSALDFFNSACRLRSSRCSLFVCLATESWMRLSSWRRVAGGSMSISMAADSVAWLSKVSVLNFFRAASTALAWLLLRYRSQEVIKTDSKVRFKFETIVSSTELRVGR